MKDLRSRVLTGALAGSLFLATYFFAPPIFLALLGGIMFWVLIMEWPFVLSMRLVDPQFWAISILYPIIPFITLMYLTSQVAHIWPLVPLYPFIAAWVVDTAGYFFGSLFGRHKCAPSISPNKTWEGLIAGVAVLYICNIALLWWYGFDLNVPFLIVSTPILAVSAIVGDLFISLLKRRSGIKDTGKLLPGHGGLLDRFDSVLCIALVIGLYLSARAATGI